MSNLDDYYGDVWYEEWRCKLPEDSISDSRINDAYHYGTSPESLVNSECQRRANAREVREAEGHECQAYCEWGHEAAEAKGEDDDTL